MHKKLQSSFSTRQYMLSKDYELYYYHDTSINTVELHTHDYYEFYFFLGGNVSLQIDKDIHQVSPGDMVILPPGLSHKPIIHDVSEPYRRFVFWISSEFCNHLLNLSADYGYLMQLVATRKTYVFHNDNITFNSIISRLLRLLEEMQSNRFGKGAQIPVYVMDLLLYLNRLVHEQNHPLSIGESESLYQNICSFIETHIEEDLSLERISREFFMSKYHIAHIFKDNLGLSIHQYITKKRLTHCRQSILSGMSITNAYETFGFGDYSSFYRAFKKEYGISPKDFRDMNFIPKNPDSEPES